MGTRTSRAEIEAALDRLRDALLALPPDEREGQLRQLEERAERIDPRGRPAEPAEGEGPAAVFRYPRWRAL